MLPRVDIYTDGACSRNPGPGGWGCVLLHQQPASQLCGTGRKELSGSSPDTTNNQMEFTAVLEGIKTLRRPCEVHIWTDSQLVVGYFAQNWRARDKDLLDLKYQVLAQIRKGGHTVEWHWLRGHNGAEHNECADRLARAAIVR